MKKIILILGLVFLNGCNCTKAPKVAIMHSSGGPDMTYHFTLYLPTNTTSHSISFKCPKVGYYVSDLYTDDLGELKRSEVIWKKEDAIKEFEYEIPYDQSMARNVSFSISKKSVIIRGLYGDFKEMNGEYKIENSPPI